ncbi:hypothetical protein EYS14_03705 [Alteromonadaceae bacterium M269]|nr:hypothetical protein EYS14_03705 [Alteromonadaceae bacterium M269]
MNMTNFFRVRIVFKNLLMNSSVLNFILVFALFFNNFSVANAQSLPSPEYRDDSTVLDIKDRTENSSNQRFSEGFGVTVSPTDQTLSLKTTDFHLPLNGPDIEISRVYVPETTRASTITSVPVEIFDWALEIPKIFVNHWRHSFSVLEECGINQAKSFQINIPSKGGFDLIGQAENIGLPEDLYYLFSNNWYLKCEPYVTRSDSENQNAVKYSKNITNGIVLKAPNGTTYRFAYRSVKHSPDLSRNISVTYLWSTFYVTDIVDIHGNWLAFDYKLIDNGTQQVPSQKLLLEKIRSSEGPTVSLSNNSRNITGIKYGNREVKYKFEVEDFSYPPYNPQTLDEVEFVDSGLSQIWKYDYEEFGESAPSGVFINRGLTKVKNPWGGQLSLEYGFNLFGCGSRVAESIFGNQLPYIVKSYNVAGADIADYAVSYHSDRQQEVEDRIANGELVFIEANDEDELALTTVTYPDRVEKYQYHCTNMDLEPLTNEFDERILDYQLKKIEIQDLSGNTVRTTEFNWQSIILPRANTLTFETDFTGPNRLVLSSKIIDGKFKTTYSDFDAFGSPLTISEENSRKQGESLDISEYTRVTKKTLLNDTSNWLIGLPRKTKVGTTNEDLVEIIDITYHDENTAEGKYNGLGLVYEKKQFGTWVSRNSEYHGNGLLKRVEFNELLLKKDGTKDTKNRFISYSDYKREQAQSLSFPGRYSTNVEDNTKIVLRIDDYGLVESITDRNGFTTTYGYDELGRLQSVLPQQDSNGWKGTLIKWSHPANGSVEKKSTRCTLSEDKKGCLSSSTVFEETISFDALFRASETKLVDSVNQETRYQRMGYDHNNYEVFKSFWSSLSAETEGTTNSYDALGRLSSSSTVGLGSQSFRYPNANVISVTDAEQNETITTFLSYGEPQTETAIKVVSPESVLTEIDVNIFGNITAITQSGFTSDSLTEVSSTEYRAYDELQHLCKVSRTDVGTSVFKRSVTGQVLWQAQGINGGTRSDCKWSIDETIKTNFTYDNLGSSRFVKSSGDAPDLTYGYDPVGNLVFLKADNVEHTYTYNSLHMLESENLVIPEIGGNKKALNLEYTFDSLGHLSSLKYPNKDIISFAPNAFGEPTKARGERIGLNAIDYASNAKYYATGNLNTFTYGNGLKHKTSLNIARLPSRIKDSNMSDIALDYSYTYDKNRNVKSLKDNQNSSFSLTNLTYDGLDRLTAVTAGVSINNATLSYDALGNITKYDNEQHKLDYVYNDSNQLASVNKTDDPNITNYRSFTYDSRGNVTSNGYRTFKFNLANQLRSSTKSGVTNTYLYDGHNRRVREIEDGVVSYSMYSQDGTLLYREKLGGGVNYIYLGSRLVAKDGVINETAGTQHAYPYGSSVEGEIDDVGYTGHKFDKDMQLSYMQSRYYDPLIGRFYSNDPVGYRGVHSFNRYAYANNNPYKYIDPDGEESDFWWTEPKKRHDDAVDQLAKKLEKQGFKVDKEVKFKVTDKEGNTSIRVMDIVATSKKGEVSLIEVKTFASKKEAKLEKVASKSPQGRVVSVGGIGVRGAQWYFQMVNDANIAENGAVNLRTGKEIGPTSVFWHGFRKTKNGFKAFPPFPITK